MPGGSGWGVSVPVSVDGSTVKLTAGGTVYTIPEVLCVTTAAIGAAGTTLYFRPDGGNILAGMAGADSFDESWIAPRAMIVLALLVQNEAILTGGATGTLAVTLMKNGVAQLLTVTVPGNSAARTNTEDLLHPITLAKGDRIQLRAVTGAANPGNIKFAFVLQLVPA